MLGKNKKTCGNNMGNCGKCWKFEEDTVYEIFEEKTTYFFRKKHTYLKHFESVFAYGKLRKPE